MAIDTAKKRFAIMDFDLPWQPGEGPPDSAVAAADRLALLWLYSFAAAATYTPNGIRLQDSAGNWWRATITTGGAWSIAASSESSPLEPVGS